MSTRILYNQAQQMGRDLQETVDLALKAKAAVDRMDDKMTSAMNGDTFDALAGELGGGISPIDAQNIWTILRNVRAAMDSAAMGELCRLDKGSPL